MTKFLPLADAVAAHLNHGDSVAFEGFTHLIPTAAAHEAIRQGFKELTLIRMTPDLIYDQMVGMGMVKKMIFSYVGNPGVGLLRRSRDAIENGWPNPVEIEEYSHAAMANAWEAGAAGLPMAVFRGFHAEGLGAVNPSIRSVACPFTGEVLAAVPSVRPDVTFIHAQKADRRGNVLIEGIIGIQKEAVLAATRAVATVEEVVDSFEGLHPNLTDPAALDARRDRRRSGRCASLLCSWLLRPRQRLLYRMGRSLRRPRPLLRMDAGECHGGGA